MAEWHHRLNGHEFEQTPGDSKGQRSLASCSPRERRGRCDLVTTRTKLKKGEDLNLNLQLKLFSSTCKSMSKAFCLGEKNPNYFKL